MIRQLSLDSQYARRWFPAYMSSLVDVLIDHLPEKSLDRFNEILNDDQEFSFESINSDFAIFTAIRILSRIFFERSLPIIIRAEIELTHRCNFRCQYCKARHSEHKNELALKIDKLKELVSNYAYFGCKWLHLNGGEISLLTKVPELVAFAVEKGMKVGISSNGSGKVAFYKNLVAAGTTYLHISFDSASREKFELLSGCPGSWSRVNETIEYLCRDAKKVNPDLFVVANVMLTKDSIFELPTTIDYLLRLGVDDIKLIPAFDESSLDENKIAILKYRLNNLFLGTTKGKLRILMFRIARLFKEGIHGIRSDSIIINGLNACELCTQQVMLRKDGLYAPCYVYMQSNYKPLSYGMGTIENSIADYCGLASTAQRERYLNDRLCINNCPDMIYRMNHRVQELVYFVLSDILEAYKSAPIDGINCASMSYKDLEAPFTKQIGHITLSAINKLKTGEIRLADLLEEKIKRAYLARTSFEKNQRTYMSNSINILITEGEIKCSINQV